MKTLSHTLNFIKGSTLRPLLCLLFIFSVSSILAQEKDNRTSNQTLAIPFSVLDEVPVFPGCEDAKDKKACFNEKIMAHIRTHFVYPPEAVKMNIEGRVNVLFTISKEGAIKNLRIRGPHALLEDATREIINKIPPMVSGGQFKGAFVDCPYTLPVSYVLGVTKK